MRRRRASSNNACTDGLGIVVSKKTSASDGSSNTHRGKKVVSAASGYTTRLAPKLCALCSSAIRRSTTASRGSERAIGPSCAAATRTVRDIVGSFGDEASATRAVRFHDTTGREAEVALIERAAGRAGRTSYPLDKQSTSDVAQAVRCLVLARTNPLWHLLRERQSRNGTLAYRILAGARCHDDLWWAGRSVWRTGAGISGKIGSQPDSGGSAGCRWSRHGCGCGG